MRVVTLHQLAGALGDGGIPAIFEPASPQVPLDAVIAQLPTSGPLRPAQLLIIPGTTAPRILQIFHLMAVQPEHPVELSRYITFVNAVIPLPGFGMNEAQTTVFYRYCLVIEADDIDVDRVGETLNQVAVLIEQFASGVAQVAAGVVGFETARDRLLAQIDALSPG
jgi:hypothetical protein